MLHSKLHFSGWLFGLKLLEVKCKVMSSFIFSTAIQWTGVEHISQFECEKIPQQKRAEPELSKGQKYYRSYFWHLQNTLALHLLVSSWESACVSSQSCGGLLHPPRNICVATHDVYQEEGEEEEAQAGQEAETVEGTGADRELSGTCVWVVWVSQLLHNCLLNSWSWSCSNSS